MKKIYGAFQIAAVYIGTVVGAGFATGKEIVEFFSRFGLIGFFTILISGYLFIVLGCKLMEKAIDLKAKSYEELNDYLFGPVLGKAMSLIMMVMLIGVCGVMLAGAGAVFEEQLMLTKQMGIFITIALSFIIMMVGTKGLFAVNTFVVPLMITFNLIVMSYSITDSQFFVNFMHIPVITDGWNSVVAPFTYTALNLALAQAVLVPVATEVNDREMVRWGGIIGGFFLTIILISSHFTLIGLPNVEMYEIPMASVMKTVGAGLYWIYVCIIYGEIFTSVIGNIYGLEKQIKKYIPVHSILIYLFVLIVSFILSQIHYGTLLSYLYPLFGYFSLVFFVLLWKKAKVV
ncbi:putative membrane protein YkvI [Oikeobacillus pervagus]|uniref:Membrane protein YkvI n=1 Tax=Oikeobacillus pervagus TaxID=1325931 RepID=A0AAJ1T1C5_9BACI|nr:GerAB/ArcD/ProY family transporter [Oikeobacillus pervagus]MDQ0214841.1 putative membrane protein YkvI [Oikeobacillus pervagus]